MEDRSKVEGRRSDEAQKIVTEVRRVALLAEMLQWATLEQLEFMSRQVTRSVSETGFAHITIVFENNNMAFMYPAPGLRFPKPNPTPAPPQMSTFGEGGGR